MSGFWYRVWFGSGWEWLVWLAVSGVVATLAGMGLAWALDRVVTWRKARREARLWQP